MINLSKAAASEIRRLQSCQKLDTKLHIGIQPGGCADVSYTIDFEEAIQSSDRLYDCNGIQVVIAQENLDYLAGLTLDYSEDLMGGAFRFHNPNALQTCGCGNSFSISANRQKKFDTTP